MTKLPNEIIENGIHYRLIGDYYFPDITDPDEIDTFGKWGDLHLKYLREYQPKVYSELLFADKLVDYLRRFNEQAAEMRQNIIASMRRAEGVTDELKKRDPAEWSQRMNWIAAAADEIVISEMVSC